MWPFIDTNGQQGYNPPCLHIEIKYIPLHTMGLDLYIQGHIDYRSVATLGDMFTTLGRCVIAWFVEGV